MTHGIRIPRARRDQRPRRGPPHIVAEQVRAAALVRAGALPTRPPADRIAALRYWAVYRRALLALLAQDAVLAARLNKARTKRARFATTKSGNAK